MHGSCCKCSIAAQPWFHPRAYKTKPNKSFSAVSIKTIINNPVYIGKIRYNIRENWSEQRRKGINHDPIIVDGEHERIITQDVWETVQKLYAKKSVTSPRVFNGTYLLTGMMCCPDCGATLVAHRIHEEGHDEVVGIHDNNAVDGHVTQLQCFYILRHTTQQSAVLSI